MKRSTSRILTTHAGSLPRTSGILELLKEREERGSIDPAVFDAGARAAVSEVVDRQLEIGLDVIDDGEQGKPSFATYVIDRLNGFGGERPRRAWRRLDSADFPDWARTHGPRPISSLRQPTCDGPITWKDWSAVEADIDRLRAATAGKGAEDVFMTSASPGVIANLLPNDYFPSHEAYLYALADAMKDEYRAIVEAGFLLQIDCPDLAMARNSEFSELSVEEFKRVVELHIDVLNGALAGIDPERLRMHVCWGNFEGPHNHDVPLAEIVELVLNARPNAICVEGANPRHAHEWKVWEDVKRPEGKVVIPGVIDTTTNFVEHPELVAQRIGRYAQVLGRENVIAGTDCGFGTYGVREKPWVDAQVAWAKLQSLTEGARLASQELW